jgi:hypothetical protein
MHQLPSPVRALAASLDQATLHQDSLPPVAGGRRDVGRMRKCNDGGRFAASRKAVTGEQNIPGRFSEQILSE